MLSEFPMAVITSSHTISSFSSLGELEILAQLVSCLGTHKTKTEASAGGQCSLLEALGGTLTLAHAGCWQNGRPDTPFAPSLLLLTPLVLLLFYFCLLFHFVLIDMDTFQGYLECTPGAVRKVLISVHNAIGHNVQCDWIKLINVSIIWEVLSVATAWEIWRIL